jgi:uncharacterized protein
MAARRSVAGGAVADLIPAATERIVERFQPLQVILFGSRAKGEARPDSDVDLLVVLSDIEDRQRVWGEIRHELREIGVSSDVVVATPEEIARRGNLVGRILRPALRDGRVLYDSERGFDLAQVERSAGVSREGIGAVSDEDRLEETHRWLRLAREDLVTANLLANSDEATPRQACFYAQQAAEKALKAVLVYLQIDFSKTHNLDQLRDLVPAGWPLKQDHPALEDLTDWVIKGRYLGDWPEPTHVDARGAVAKARALWSSVLEDLSSHGLDVSRHR